MKWQKHCLYGYKGRVAIILVTSIVYFIDEIEGDVVASGYSPEDWGICN